MPKARFPDKFGRYRLGADGVLRRMQGRTSSPIVAIVTLRPRNKPEPQVEAAIYRQETGEQPLSNAPKPAARMKDAVLDIIASAAEPGPARAPRPRPPVRSKYAPSEGRGHRQSSASEIPFHLRRRNIDEATAYLRRRAILVDVVDRTAMVRTYRVSGKRDAMLAEGVIEIACQHGFEVIT